MADKARAARAGKIGEYKYGEDSGQDRRILEFLGISADDFQEAAVNNPNDVEIGTWVLETAAKGRTKSQRSMNAWRIGDLRMSRQEPILNSVAKK